MDESTKEVSTWKPWQIALAVGAPVAVGLAGIWYIQRKTQSSSKKLDKVDPVKKVVVQSEQGDQNEIEQTPYDKAQSAKSRGNKYFKGQAYEKAISCYTEAIELCPQDKHADISTYYQNRAAAHEQLKDYEEVIADCTQALQFNQRYLKALHRRARALEVLGGERLVHCLEDVTALCILEAFQNQNSLKMAERILRQVGKLKAKEAFQMRDPTEPSKQFIKTYFMAFANDPILKAAEKPLWDGRGDMRQQSSDPIDNSAKEKYTDETPEKDLPEDKVTQVTEVTEVMTSEPEEGEQSTEASPYSRALDQLSKNQYSCLVTLCTEEIEAASSGEGHLTEALLLRATFYLLRGEADKAMADFDRLVTMGDVPKRIKSNTLIKRGSLKMQGGHQLEALSDFAAAVREDPENSDIYHHRGQLHLLIDQVDDAARDFEKSVQLSPSFAIAHAQKCYTEYRLAMRNQSPIQLNKSLGEFEKVIERFPECSEAYALYGQALSDQQEFDKADQHFKKASELDSTNGNLDVHRGLLRLQWKQNIEEAARLIEGALVKDSKCEFAYETLGTIEVQRGNLDRAVSLFQSAISLAKTEVEMEHLCSLLQAAIAQSRVATKFGIQVPTLG